MAAAHTTARQCVDGLLSEARHLVKHADPAVLPAAIGALRDALAFLECKANSGGAKRKV